MAIFINSFHSILSTLIFTHDTLYSKERGTASTAGSVSIEWLPFRPIDYKHVTIVANGARLKYDSGRN